MHIFIFPSKIWAKKCALYTAKYSSKRYGARWPTEADCCLFDRIEEAVKHKPRPAIHMEKQVGWACKLSGTESQGISRTEQTVLMEFHTWHLPAGSVAVEEDLEKRQWPFCLGKI